MAEMVHEVNRNSKGGLNKVLFPSIFMYIELYTKNVKLYKLVWYFSQLSFHCGDCLKDGISPIIWKMRLLEEECREGTSWPVKFCMMYQA